jgi:hypothetical protein
MVRFVCVAMIALLLGACAAFNNVSNEVSTFGAWPPDRRPATFVFERLPSQQVHPERQLEIESAARGALEDVGFHAVADPNDAEYLMQIGARVATTDPWIYNDPLFLRGYGWGYGRWGRPGWWGPGYGYGWGGVWGPYDIPNFEREVVLLIRDRKSGQLLYEARANNSGPSASIDYLLPAMFAAAMNNFPSAGPNPRTVTTPISTAPA